MQYDEFILCASARKRLAGGEARDLASQLPKELQPDLIPPTQEAQPLQVQDFVRRVGEQAHVDDGEAWMAVAAVLTTTREAVTPGEWDDVASQMGRALDVLRAGAW